MPSAKTRTLWNWKNRGLIHDDYDALYETYINTMECQHCNKELKNTTDRCMDHDHETGLFRKIVCRACNIRDAYINYPNGFTEEERKKYYENHKEERKVYDKNRYEQNKEKLSAQYKEYSEKNKEKISARRKEKINCECGAVVSRHCIAEHRRSKKHSNWVLLQSE